MEKENVNNTIKKVNKTVGKIKDCQLLNVREEASLNSKVLIILDKNSTFKVDKKNSTEDFYKISLKKDSKVINGYCLKKFVELSSSVETTSTEKGE